MGDYVALATFACVVAILINIPSTRGLGVYPLGNLVGIPLALMAYAVLRYGAIPVSGQALTVSRRLSAISLTLIPLIALLLMSFLSQKFGTLNAALHLALILLPLLLFGFLLMFIFARPIAAQLDMSYGELTIAYDELKQAQARLVEAEKMSSIGVMIAGIAHELNNPLTALQGQISLLARHLRKVEELPPKIADHVTESLDIQESAASRMEAIVKGLSQYSREDRDTPEMVNVLEILQNTLVISNARIKPIPVKIEVNEALDLVPIFPGKVSQIVSNLLVNAADACREAPNPTIHMSAFEVDMNLYITVQDNGPGIPDDIVANIFDPFFTTKEVGKGTGLGLALCKRFAQDMKGDLNYHRVDEKTTFSLQIPTALNL